MLRSASALVIIVSMLALAPLAHARDGFGAGHGGFRGGRDFDHDHDRGFERDRDRGFDHDHDHDFRHDGFFRDRFFFGGEFCCGDYSYAYDPYFYPYSYSPPAAVYPPTTEVVMSPTAIPGRANCRQFQTMVTIDGKRQQAVGTACQQPNGSWRVAQ